MNTNKPLEVKIFLSSLYYHLKGDLGVFDSICKKEDDWADNGISTGERFDLSLPIAQSLFAVADLLGFLIGNEDIARDAKNNYENFFNDTTIKSDHERRLLKKYFRHKISHNYFPHRLLGVSSNLDCPDDCPTDKLWDKLFFRYNNEQIVLNVVKLKEIVIKRFTEIMRDNNNLKGMSAQFEKLYSHQEKNELEELLKNIS